MRPATAPEKFFPSDRLPEAGGPFHLAGRIVSREPSAVWIADAFATLRVTWTFAPEMTRRGPTAPPAVTAALGEGPVSVEVGDLVVLSVSRAPKGLELCSLIERHVPSCPTGKEHARFAQGGVGRNLCARAHAFATARRFFTDRGFLEVDTPQLVPSPGLDFHLDAIEATGGFLMTSPEYQMKRLLVGGVPRLFQMSHVFRQDESGIRHNPEFAMLEWYRAFEGVGTVMDDTEDVVTAIVLALHGHHDLVAEHGPVRVASPFARMTVADAFERFARVGETDYFAMAERDPDLFYRTLVEQVEPAIAAMDRPLFLFDYPISQASLARRNPSDPRVCERFELYLGGVELCNGFGELTCPDEQRRRFLEDQRLRRAAGKAVYPIDDRFLAALEEGMPPSAGNALGLDRLVALALGEREIARVMPFPKDLV
ncbi:MAG TPA: EF-P lysine aminoacylase EpmA [Polyangiaceae bacterium]|nr:EF-P lysine aminoacylase EpmA [Polyangiaceae bacterium]